MAPVLHFFGSPGGKLGTLGPSQGPHPGHGPEQGTVMDPTFALLRLGWALYTVARYRHLVDRGDHYIARRLARAHLRSIAAQHGYVCHSDGSTCDDGCDVGPIPGKLAELEAVFA